MRKYDIDDLKFEIVDGEIEEGDCFLSDKVSIHQLIRNPPPRPPIFDFHTIHDNRATYKIIVGYKGEKGKEYKAHPVNHSGSHNKKVRLF